MLVAQQKVFFNGKKYNFSQAVDYYLDNIRNYFLKDEEIIIPKLSVEDYEYWIYRYDYVWFTNEYR